MRAPIVQGGLRRAKARATAREFALGDGDAHLVANARGGIRRVGVVDGVRIDAAVALEHGDERGVLAGETRGATLGVVARGFCGARAVAPLAKRGMGGRVRGGGRGGDVVPGDVARGRSHEAEARGVEVGPELRLARRRLGERARFRRERLLQSLHRRLAHAQARRRLRDLHGFWGWLISRPLISRRAPTLSPSTRLPAWSAERCGLATASPVDADSRGGLEATVASSMAPRCAPPRAVLLARVVPPASVGWNKNG